MHQIISYYQENTQKISEYRLRSRYLWEDHISYTRNAIISTLSSLADASLISTRLLKNQEDLGTFISPYYTTETINTFVDLLKQHIIIAAEVINGVESAEKKWLANGDDITNFMYMMNKAFWPIAIIRPLWNTHMALTIAQINSRKNQAWADDIQAYDENHVCVSQFSDLFANGVIYQNIDHFCLNTPGELHG